MSIKRYTNIEQINNKSDNEGKYILSDDLFIVSQNQIEETDFGNGKYDVMEVSVYDINNNILPQKTGNFVAYIKPPDIKNYLYSITNQNHKRELVVNAEKLLNDLGFYNGILRVNINFVRNKVGNDNQFTRVWIQQISPSRSEIRILPLKVVDETISSMTYEQFLSLGRLDREFKQYKEEILISLDSIAYEIPVLVDNMLTATYGSEYKQVLASDFALTNFDAFINRIFNDYRVSVIHYLNNRHYNIGQSNFGIASDVRFEDSEIYNHTMIERELQSILRKCIDIHMPTLARRLISITRTNNSIQATELQVQIQDLLDELDVPQSTNITTYRDINVEFTTDVEFATEAERPNRVPVYTVPIIKQPVIEPETEVLPTNENTVVSSGRISISDNTELRQTERL
jgi:hypothetical protein